VRKSGIRVALAVVLGAVLALTTLALPAQAASATANANFAVGADYPLIKSKFGVFNSGYVSPARWARDAPLLAPLHPGRVRWELQWGNEQPGWTPMVGGTAGAPTYSFAQVDQVVDEINAAHAQAVPMLVYTPTPLQPAGGSWNSPPSNFSTLANQVVPAFVNHWRSTGRPIGSYEIGNEPDLPGVFWTGTEAQYLSLYGQVATAIRNANPDAYIEGPALCCVSWSSDFVNNVITNNLPLDGFSFHGYGSIATGTSSAYQGATDSGLTTYRMASVDNNLNEYNYTNDFTAPTDLTTYRAAPELLTNFKALLAKPWITHVEWAQFQDPICPSTCDVIGLLDQDGHRRATYNAYDLYARMPVDRKALTISGSVDGMASSDAHKSGVLLWNTSGSTQSVTSALQNVPFANGNFRVYRIDASHASYGDNPANETLVPTEQSLGVSMSSLSWSGDIPDHGVVYLEATDGSTASDLDAVQVGTAVRTLNYMPNHSKTSWASFDRNTWTAQLGMATENFADAETGVVAENLPRNLTVRFDTQGTPQQLDANSLLGMRIDFATSSGYTKGVLIHDGVYNASRSAPVPWGTGAAPNQVVQVPTLSNASIDLASLAPAGWNGRVTMSFIAQNLGAGVRSSVTVRPADVALYSITNINSGKVLSIDGASQVSAAVQQYSDNGAADHNWELVDAGSGYYKILNGNSGLALGIAGASTVSGTQAVQFDDNGSSDQRWKLTPVGTGTYKLENQNSGMVLGVVGNALTDNANTAQFAYTGAASQQWRLTGVTDPVLATYDFENQSTTGWSVQSGTWGICHPVTYEYCSTTTADGVSLTGSSAWRAVTTSASVLPDSAPVNSGIALLARAQDGTHYYEGELKKNSDGSLAWTISKNNGGSWTLLASGSHPWKSGAGNYSQLRFAAKGVALTLEVGTSGNRWQTLGTASDSTFTSGKAGVRTWGMTGKFDNVRIVTG
jgi:hypothetical protein